MINQVPPEYIDGVWPEVSPMVERALKYSAGYQTSPERIYTALLLGEMILWVVIEGDKINAATVLEVVQYPQKKAIKVILIAGKDVSHEMAQWKQLQELITDFADIIGAELIEATVRDGLTKVLPKFGWKRKATIMTLDNERYSR